MQAWLIERLKHGAIYVGAAILIGFILYKIFIQPSNKNIVNNSAPQTHYHYGEGSNVKTFGCATFRTDKP